jgi:Flp pilus assembly protein TadD
MTGNPSNRPAWESFSRAWVASRPKDPDAWYSLGYTLSQRASEVTAAQITDPSIQEAARHAYTKALELNPGYARAWNNLGVTQDELGESEAAATSFRMAVQLKNDYGLAWLNLGTAYINTRKYREAAQALRSGLDQVPVDAPSWARLAFCDEKQGNLDAAIRHLRIALGLGPMRMEWWMDLAQVCRRAKRPGEFETTLDFLRARLPSFAQEVSRRAKASDL